MRSTFRHRTYLIRKVAWKLWALAEGDLTERARRRAEELARESELRVTPPKAVEPAPVVAHAVVSTDPRLPAPGTGIVQLYPTLGSLLPVLDELARRDCRNKTWHTKSGEPKGGRPFDKSTRYALLTNLLGSRGTSAEGCGSDKVLIGFSAIPVQAPSKFGSSSASLRPIFDRT